MAEVAGQQHKGRVSEVHGQVGVALHQGGYGPQCIGRYVPDQDASVGDLLHEVYGTDGTDPARKQMYRFRHDGPGGHPSFAHAVLPGKGGFMVCVPHVGQRVKVTRVYGNHFFALAGPRWNFSSRASASTSL